MVSVVNAPGALTFDSFRSRAQQIAGDVLAPDGAMSPAAERFLAQVHGDFVNDDAVSLPADDLAFLCAGFWAWAQQAADDGVQMRLMPARGADGASLGRDVLEVVTPDKAFLVDSVMGEVNAAGADVLSMVHPIVALTRPGRSTAQNYSMIQVQMGALEERARDALRINLRATLSDVEVAVRDFAAMRLRMDQATAELSAAKLAVDEDERADAIAFLRWLRSNHFTFLGVRDYTFARGPGGAFLAEEPLVTPGASLGILRDEERYVLRRGSEPAFLASQIEDLLRAPEPLIVAKATLQSRVHRRTALDYVGVKRYDETGEVIGETRFAGLFTSDAYHDTVGDIPLIRRKVRNVLSQSGFTPGSHSEKRLRNILETHPRNELFESSQEDLLAIAVGIARLNDRPRTRLFVRRDQYDRYLSAFALIPRERFNSRVRERIGAAIARAVEGEVTAFTPHFDGGPLARVHYTIDIRPFDNPPVDMRALEAEVAALTRTWDDEFIDVVRESHDFSLKTAAARYVDAFSPGYKDIFPAAVALQDIAILNGMGETRTAVWAGQREGDAPDLLRLRLYQRDGALPLSDIIPILEHMGLTVLTEAGFPVEPAANRDEDTDRYWIHEFTARAPQAALRQAGDHVGDVHRAVEEAFAATLDGRNENDGFNRLVLYLGVHWRDVCFLRACARYRQQTGLDPSQAVQEAALADNAAIVRLILELKDVRFNPALAVEAEERAERQDALSAQIYAAIDDVASLDADRALRRITNLIRAVQRTNFYQRDAEGAAPGSIALKIASQELDNVPDPKPYREIFVWAPHVEGVHIRFGPIARGGLRWSDRRDDFRTEVLGLAKAQQVKNSVIVPVGAKGGFFPKKLPREGGRDAIQKEGVRAYKTFISALLDVTDNLANDIIVPPRDVVRWDGDDPYLVVAADKGTASFSDIANDIAVSRNFWLGDAFASGGSAGYDHKKMGITARGAWESVKRHFAERGKDIQHEPFTVIGVGDMSGDVFGNGMLLSRCTRLQAAFDHRDIFLDPNPQDPERNWEERRRLFGLERSSWQDYDVSLISDGGGVFSRSTKSIPLSPQVRALLGVEEEALSPHALISAILKIEAELLWFGGIGTYVKASHEQHYEVGDRANDGLRIDAGDVGASVIGEGANLGLTQAARVELARRGVRLNGDFVDNAGGVDSSDHEVNIKVLLNKIVASGRLDMEARNRLLADMTQDVGEHVLSHNYDQALAISLAETTAASDLDAHERLIERLEARGLLDRELEELPSAEAFRERKALGVGLTRPEIAILMAYAKNSLYDRILNSSVPDDPHLNGALIAYFPRALRETYRDDIQRHPLRREIIATILSNQMVNIGGATFAHRAREATGADTDAVARGFAATQAMFGFQDLVQRIHDLDTRVPASVQSGLYGELIMLLRRQTYWLVRRGRGLEQDRPRPLQDTIEAYRDGLQQLRALDDDVISPYARKRADDRAQAFIKAGAPEDLVQAVVRLRPLMSSSDVVDLAQTVSAPLAPVAYLYHACGDRFRFDELRGVLGSLDFDEHWDRLAARRFIDDLYLEHQRICRTALGDAANAPEDAAAARQWAQERLAAFVAQNASETQRLDEAYEEMSAGDAWSFSKVIITLANIREFSALAR